MLRSGWSDMVATVETPIELEIDISESLIQEAERIWRASREFYRDSTIKIGRLLQQIIIFRLKQADGKTVKERLNNRLTRESTVVEVADRLKIKKRHAYEMIRVSIVVDLFGNPGKLTYSTLREFTVLIQRRKCKIIQRRNKKSSDEVLPSESEVWEIKTPINDINLREVYNRAVVENWESKYTKKFIDRNIIINRGKSGQGLNDGSKISQNKLEFDDRTPLLKVAIMSDPKDLVDMVLNMIKVCPRAEEFKRLLLQKIK